MANLAPPSSQKAGIRPISFLLDSQLGAAPAFVDLVVRPEDLVRTDPSRATVQQTLGGAWLDNFGPGIAQITISGHTGWRRTEATGEDGLERFERLRDTVYTGWHEQRKTNVNAGMDPDEVRLIFSDALDNFSAVVAPMSFTLRRSKSRPLLCQYQLSMLVLDDNGSAPPVEPARGGFLDADLLEAAGLDSLTASANRITGMLNGVKTWVDATLVAPVQAFMNQTARLFAAVRAAISAGVGVVQSLLTVARMAAQAGVNLFRTLAAVAAIPQIAKASLMALAGAYSNIFCVLRNAIGQKLYYQDYTDLYGASNCSSTSGGRPISVLAGENPFYKVVPTAGPSPFTLTQPAQTSMLAIANSDPALAPMSTTLLGATVRGITEGLVVA